MASKVADRGARGRRILLRIVLPCLLGLLWAGLRAHTFGSVTALLSVGPEHASYHLIRDEIPGVYVFPGNGFDGMDYYAIARNPLDVSKTAPELDLPAYRMRRILFPLAAGSLAPGGGIALIYAFVLLSVVGIGLGGWWIAKFPGAPPWLPLIVGISPGVICTMFISTGDALAAGLTIAAFGAAFDRRFRLMLLFLALAALTRETALLAAASLALWPGFTARRRAATLVLPAIPVVVWSIFVSAQSHHSFFEQPLGGTFTFPFAGWVAAHPTGGLVAFAGLLGVVLAAGTVIAARRNVPVAFFCGATFIVFCCSTPIITYQWFGFARVTTAAFPLAVWALFAPSPAQVEVGRSDLTPR